MFTLNFREYLEMKAFLGKEINTNKTAEFNEYLRFGGFPKTLEFDEPADKDTYIADVIKQILEKDVVRHKKIRNRAVFDKVMTYIINNFGATVSLGGIAEYFDVDPTLVRIGYAALTMFTAFCGIILYPILWIIMPEKH